MHFIFKLFLLFFAFHQYGFSYQQKMTFKTFLNKKKLEYSDYSDILNVLNTIKISSLQISKLLSYSHIEKLNGYFEKDVFATSYVEINTWLKKITFFRVKMEHMKRSEGIKFDTINISKSEY